MASRLSLFLLVVCSLAVAQAQLRLFNLHASGLPSDIFGITDAYIKVFSGSTHLGTTAVRHNNKNPWWDEEFTYYPATDGSVLTLEVFDEDVIFDDLVGRCTRELRVGSYDIDCYLAEGGTLHYSYSLG
ncbi:perforin-1-like [Nelusetta ayraudi]|uniref:perforin-1-like n=1 Tax=Nelusetta ayraudi TaxID=303726 RepID=UPI003F704EAB